jgi:hypothetical protein
VGAGEVELEDGSEARRIWDLDLCETHLRCIFNLELLLDGIGRTDSAAEQEATSSSSLKDGG